MYKPINIIRYVQTRGAMADAYLYNVYLYNGFRINYHGGGLFKPVPFQNPDSVQAEEGEIGREL